MAIRSAATSSLLCVITALIADQEKQGTLDIIGIFLIDDEFKYKTLKNLVTELKVKILINN